ncbi:MAG: hypothetical protein IPP26_11280 [Flavobacteriales bacterium]|nr:hypothetical protein [Flavobacteriales bacterium]
MTVVSCWHLREYESKSMWDRYAGKEDRSIAVRSTVGGLQRALKHFEGDMNFARVGYIDFDKQNWMDGKHYTIPSYNFIVPIITKSIEYPDEQELRLTYRLNDWDHASFWGKQELDSGLFIPVDLHELVHAVILAPGTSAEHAEEIRDVIRQVGLSPRVFSSSLDRTPVY